MIPPERWELLKESEWMRVYRVGPKNLHYASKFLTDGLKVSSSTIKIKWHKMSPDEHLEFALAFSAKPDLTLEDEKILSFLMEVGPEEIWSTISIRLPQHSQREHTIQFLIERLKQTDKNIANYCQALEIMGDHSAVPALRLKYEQYRKQIAEAGTAAIGVSDLLDYLSCASALLTLEGLEEYRTAIGGMLGHPDSVVQLWARQSLSRK